MVLYPTWAQDGQACVQGGQPSPELPARRCSAAAGGHVLLPTQDPAGPARRTALWPPALHARGAHSLSRAQSRKAGGGMISVPASSSPHGHSIHKFYTRLHSAFTISTQALGQTTRGQSTAGPLTQHRPPRGWEQNLLRNLGPAQSENEGLLFQNGKNAIKATKI